MTAYPLCQRPFVASLDSITIPKTLKETLNHPGWFDAMFEEIHGLEENHTWNLVDLHTTKKLVGC